MLIAKETWHTFFPLGFWLSAYIERKVHEEKIIARWTKLILRRSHKTMKGYKLGNQEIWEPCSVRLIFSQWLRFKSRCVFSSLLKFAITNFHFGQNVFFKYFFISVTKKSSGNPKPVESIIGWLKTHTHTHTVFYFAFLKSCQSLDLCSGKTVPFPISLP